jgi:hypothetical protein
MTILHKDTTKPCARCITINIERLHDVLLCQNRRCGQQLFQGLERFIMLCIPAIFLIFIQKISDGFGDFREVQDESMIIASQSEEAVNLMHSPWWLPI